MNKIRFAGKGRVYFIDVKGKENRINNSFINLNEIKIVLKILNKIK
jgi:hypothetical protein